MGSVKACSQNEQGDIVATFSFSPDSGIFAGHFPGNPIVPGICQLEAVKYMLERTLGCKCRLLQADNIKFFQPVFPDQEFTLVVSCTKNGDNMLVRCKGTTGGNDVKSTDIKARYEIK
jgi:3-hydroxyacyl-[acyl-carrier-protein] dehydratase